MVVAASALTDGERVNPPVTTVHIEVLKHHPQHATQSRPLNTVLQKDAVDLQSVADFVEMPARGAW